MPQRRFQVEGEGFRTRPRVERIEDRRQRRCPRPRYAIVLAIVALALEGCASAGTVSRPLGAPAPEVESRLLMETRPGEARILVFDWRLNERGSRLEGQGVARLEPPYRVRLDLFTENGETAARAALVGGDLRIPPDVDRRLIPPPALLWASLGIFHPGTEAQLLGGERLVDPDEDTASGRADGAESAAQEEEARDDGRMRLRYRMPGGEVGRFMFDGDRLEAAELVRGDDVIERVELEHGDSGGAGAGAPHPVSARYRDRSAFRELQVTLEESRRPLDPFPADIWLLGR